MIDTKIRSKRNFKREKQLTNLKNFAVATTLILIFLLSSSV